jgi:hypothetical protein
MNYKKMKPWIWDKENLDQLWKCATDKLSGGYTVINSETNSFGFAGSEFKEAADIVALGCSFTFGQGVYPGSAWPNHIEKYLNKKVHNLGAPAKGVPFNINSFFDYVNEFGNPKYVLCLFPNFTRIEMVSRSHDTRPSKKHITSGKLPELYEDEKIIQYSLSLPISYDSKPKYFKSPLLAEEVIPQEFAHTISIQYIKMLEAYCNTNNIVLLWTTWMNEQNSWIKNNIEKTFFRNFIYLNNLEFHSREEDERKDILCDIKHEPDKKCYTESNCHQKEKDLYGKNFMLADDWENYKDINIKGHWGVHRHLHVAEMFLRGINDYNIRNK